MKILRFKSNLTVSSSTIFSAQEVTVLTKARKDEEVRSAPEPLLLRDEGQNRRQERQIPPFFSLHKMFTFTLM